MSQFQSCVCVTPGNFMQAYVWADSRTLWEVPLECKLKCHGVQHVLEAGIRMRTCFSCPQSLLLQSVSSHWLQRKIIPCVEEGLCEPHLVPSCEAAHISVTRTVSWEGFGRGNEESPDWTFIVIPQRGSDETLFLLWTVSMLCWLPLCPDPHFVLSGTREKQWLRWIACGKV